MEYGRPSGGGDPPGAQAGITVIEISICLVIVATVLLATARAFSESLGAVGQARDTTSAAIFLETTLEDVTTQPYDNLLSLNGNRLFDRTDAGDSRFAIDLSVFLAEVDLIQMRAALVDLRTGGEIGRATTFRSRR